LETKISIIFLDDNKENAVGSIGNWFLEIGAYDLVDVELVVEPLTPFLDSDRDRAVRTVFANQTVKDQCYKISQYWPRILKATSVRLCILT
jgi:hypothetical protein